MDDITRSFLFSVWVAFGEQKWITLAERRGLRPPSYDEAANIPETAPLRSLERQDSGPAHGDSDSYESSPYTSATCRLYAPESTAARAVMKLETASVPQIQIRPRIQNGARRPPRMKRMHKSAQEFTKPPPTHQNMKNYRSKPKYEGTHMPPNRGTQTNKRRNKQNHQPPATSHQPRRPKAAPRRALK